jgi:hypothetical protein
VAVCGRTWASGDSGKGGLDWLAGMRGQEAEWLFPHLNTCLDFSRMTSCFLGKDYYPKENSELNKIDFNMMW